MTIPLLAGKTSNANSHTSDGTEIESSAYLQSYAHDPDGKYKAMDAN